MNSFKNTAMKKKVRGHGSGWKLLTEDEVEVAEILLSLPKLFTKSELITRYSFTWGQKEKRSVPESSQSPSSEKMTAVEADTRTSTSSAMNVFKRKAEDELVEVYNRMHQAMGTQEQKTGYSRNMEDFHTWNCSPMKPVDEQQLCHQQITMFSPSTSQHHYLPQLVDPDSDKLVGVSRFGVSNHGDPCVKIHGETYDFMGLSQPLGRSECLVKGDDLKVRNAAAVRKKRIIIGKDEREQEFFVGHEIAKKL